MREEWSSGPGRNHFTTFMLASAHFFPDGGEQIAEFVMVSEGL